MRNEQHAPKDFSGQRQGYCSPRTVDRCGVRAGEYLPSLDEIETLNSWSMSFCEFTACMLSNESFLPHSVSARMAALHVVAKILGKDLECGGCYSEGEDFF
jgi:hypothetical protein